MLTYRGHRGLNSKVSKYQAYLNEYVLGIKSKNTYMAETIIRVDVFLYEQYRFDQAAHSKLTHKRVIWIIKRLFRSLSLYLTSSA